MQKVGLTFQGTVIVAEQVPMTSKKNGKSFTMIKAFPVGVLFVSEPLAVESGSFLEVEGNVLARDKGIDLQLMRASCDDIEVYVRQER